MELQYWISQPPSYHGQSKSVHRDSGLDVMFESIESASFILINAKTLEEFSAKIGQNLVSEVYLNGECLISNSHKIV